jgi:hypothetical protein
MRVRTATCPGESLGLSAEVPQVLERSEAVVGRNAS